MTNYLDLAQRQEIQALAGNFTAKTEWPTWLLLCGVYAGWFAVMLASHWLGVWLSTLVLIPLVTLWLSLQHELLHGHPTRSTLVNKLLGYAPFAVWYPYTLYRDSHLLHHRDEDLTLPGIDPESRYLNQQQWADSSRVQRSMHWLTKTVLGRFLLAAPLGISRVACVVPAARGVPCPSRAVAGAQWWVFGAGLRPVVMRRWRGFVRR